MNTSHISSDHRIGGRSTKRRALGWACVCIYGATAVAGIYILAFGVWALAAPQSFATFVNFTPYNAHFLHDAGVFQIGIGATLLFALLWHDALTVALAGFFVSNTLHTVNHVLDQDLGGHATDPFVLGALSLIAGIALILRVREVRRAEVEQGAEVDTVAEDLPSRVPPL